MNQTIDRVKGEFLENLKTEVSENTFKFYRSDLEHFNAWLLKEIDFLGALASNLTQALPFLNQQLARKYKESLVGARLSEATINRHLSTLRSLGKFLRE